MGERDGSGALENYAGPPHSVIWRGGAVHLRAPAPPSARPDLHAHFAIQLTIAVSPPVSFRPGKHAPERLAPGWLIGPDRPHWLIGRGAGVTIFWDPLSPSGRLLRSRVANTAASPLSEAEALAARREFEVCWQRGWTAPDLRSATGKIANILALPDSHAAPIDPRVQLAIERLLADPSANASLAELAAAAGLSESRLAHLFRRDVGIPMRQYRLALRMEEAATQIALGASLTEAAHAAGFSDSAHFCRICRRMYGGAPSDLPEFELERRPRR